MANLKDDILFKKCLYLSFKHLKTKIILLITNYCGMYLLIKLD